MNEPDTSPIVSGNELPRTSFSSYLTGFIICLVITLAAYVIAVSDGISDKLALGLIGALAIVQCYVQLRRFLHLGDETGPRLRLATFGVMLAVVLILVIGSLWIMSNLNYRMIHSPEQMKEYIESQDGL